MKPPGCGGGYADGVAPGAGATGDAEGDVAEGVDGE
jgi:hypothetical protein